MKEGVMSESRQPNDTAPDVEATLDALGLPVVTLDAGTKILSANSAWRAAGLAHVGQLYPTSDSLAQASVRDVCEGRAERREIALKGYLLRAVCLRAEPRLCLVTHLPLQAASEDVETLREELAIVRQQLLQAQKLEAVGRLSSGVAHDFNNMLTSIICFTRFVVDEMVAEDPRRADLIEVLKSADHAARLTNQLLAFARRKPLQPVPINVNDALASVGRVLRRTLGEQIELVLEPSDEPVWVSCDPGQFDQLLFNLAVQARDELDEQGGAIRFKLARLRVSASSTSGLPAGDYIELLCKYKMGAREPQSGPSSLCLATCRVIAEQAHGALLQLVDAPSAGYRVLLPAAEVRGGTRRTSLSPLHLRGTALVVEDQPAILRTMVRALSTAGLNVLQASSAEDAIAVLETVPDAQVDLVVTDVVLPRMSGPRLVEALRGRFPALPALFVSGYVGEEIVAGAQATEDAAFVTKPFTGRQLAVRAAALLGQRGQRDLSRAYSTRS
jgi:two-component system, cell cycle sensor histidine kinase and response regulator CckA